GSIKLISTNSPPTTLKIDANGTSLDFTAAIGFHGRATYEYEADDDVATTKSDVARVTVQVLDGVSTHSAQAVLTGPFEKRDQAELSVAILDPITKLAKSVFNVGDLILVRVSSKDLRPTQHVTAVTNV